MLEFLENVRIARKCQNCWKYTDLRAEGAKVGVFQFTPTFAPKARRPPASTRPSSLSCVLDILCICTIYVSIRCIYQRLKIFLCFICFICFFVYAVSFIAMLQSPSLMVLYGLQAHKPLELDIRTIIPTNLTSPRFSQLPFWPAGF